MSRDAAALTADAPYKGRILKRNPDGTGIVEMPVCVEEQAINLRRTSGGQAATVAITSADIAQMAANFKRWKGPIPIDRENHRDPSDGSAAPGFIESVRVVGKALWASVFLTADLLKEVAGGYWRGFSPDLHWDVKRASFALDGCALGGGVFTNRPATDLNTTFAGSLAATTAGESGTFVMQFAMAADTPPPQEEHSMEVQDVTVQLATASSKLVQAEGTIATLTASNDTLTGELKAAKDRATDAETAMSAALSDKEKAVLLAARRDTDAKQSETTITNLEARLSAEKLKVTALQNEQTASLVIKVCREGIRRGVPPSFFGSDGLKSVETDPCAWLSARFNSTKALEDFVDALPKNASLTLPAGVNGEDSNDAVMDADRKANLKKLNLDPRLASVTSEAEFNRLKEAEASK